MQLQIDSINDLIEKKKKALATEKDLYEYQRKVAKQTKNIALIQKQIAALSGDHSEEARAKLQKLQLSLEDAQEELRDTEYDRFAKGGIASTLNKAAKDNDDDGIITIQKGEAVLNKEETKALQGVADHLVNMGLPYTEEQLNILREYQSKPLDFSSRMQQYGNAPVNNTKNTSVNMGDVNIHLDGTGVTDKDSFRKALRDYDIRSDIEQIALGDLSKGSVRNSMRYI